MDDDIQLENILEPFGLYNTLFNASESFNSQISSFKTPAISIIIPMYNVENYISECLDSLFNQTFQNFEVIVVDDCSTDNSIEIVNSYIPSFGGRLKLYCMEKNSGHAPAPRNKGFFFSQGEYVFFMDSDDVITETALEEMYTLAKEYDADVVYCEKYYISEGTGKKFRDNAHIADDKLQEPPFVDKPTLESDDLNERIDLLMKRNYWVTPWQRLVSRKLLIENNITFPEILMSEDVIWCFEVLCCAKKFLRVPNICYIRRLYEESSTKSKKKSPNKYIHQWLDVTIRGLKMTDDFMDKFEFFHNNPDYRYKVFSRVSISSFNVTYSTYENMSPEEIYNIFLTEFSKDTGSNNVLVSFLCTTICEKFKALNGLRKKYKSSNEAQNYERRIANLEEENARLKEEKMELMKAHSSPNSSIAVSVVIPMYNVEKYIEECLDSLLIQTFKNFEVIVVDDCSTDKSVEIVKSYMPNFNGRLMFMKTKKNSGGGGYIPRNLGLKFASGEYVIFLDSDDFLLGSALETLYTNAKKHNADVVYSSIYYDIVDKNDVRLHTDGLSRILSKKGVKDEVALTVNDNDKLFREFLASAEGNFRAPWSKFIRRDFLLKNEIVFPDIITGGDCVWCVNVYAHAKRFLRLPVPVYFYRRCSVTSISRTIRLPAEQLSYWISAFIAFFKALNELQDKVEFLKNNPFYCYETVRDGHFKWILDRTDEARKKLSNREIYEILYREFGKENNIFESAIPFFFSLIDSQQKMRENNPQTNNNLKKQHLLEEAPATSHKELPSLPENDPNITARIDFEFVSKIPNGNLQIFSVSDKNADISMPEWFQKNGIGYQILSHSGKLEITSKTTTDGQIRIRLRGLHVANPKDKSKRIPYWIDYTKLIVNRKKIFDKITPTWHDKPYRYDVNIKAYEEFKVQIKWEPHKSNT